MTTPDMSSSGSSTTRPGAIRDAGTDAGTGTSARQQIRDVKDQVVDRAKTTFEQARSRATGSLDESRGQFAEQIGGVAHAFRRTGDQLRNENQDRLAGLTDTVANQVEQVANYMRDRSPREMRADLERVARRQPAAVIGSAFAIGLLAARFFKSSRGDGDRDLSSSEQYGSGSYAGAGAGSSGYTRSGYAGPGNEGLGYTSGRSGTGQSGGASPGGQSRGRDAGTRRPGEPNYPPPTGGFNPGGGDVGGGYAGT